MTTFSRPFLAAVFAFALMLQTTCDAFCRTSICKDEPAPATIVAPNCHHAGHGDQPAGKSKECAHQKLIGSPAIQTKISMGPVLHDLAVAPSGFVFVSLIELERHSFVTAARSSRSRPPSLNLRI